MLDEPPAPQFSDVLQSEQWAAKLVQETTEEAARRGRCGSQAWQDVWREALWTLAVQKRCVEVEARRMYTARTVNDSLPPGTQQHPRPLAFPTPPAALPPPPPPPPLPTLLSPPAAAVPLPAEPVLQQVLQEPKQKQPTDCMSAAADMDAAQMLSTSAQPLLSEARTRQLLKEAVDEAVASARLGEEEALHQQLTSLQAELRQNKRLAEEDSRKLVEAEDRYRTTERNLLRMEVEQERMQAECLRLSSELERQRQEVTAGRFVEGCVQTESAQRSTEEASLRQQLMRLQTELSQSHRFAEEDAKSRYDMEDRCRAAERTVLRLEMEKARTQTECQRLRLELEEEQGRSSELDSTWQQRWSSLQRQLSRTEELIAVHDGERQARPFSSNGLESSPTELPGWSRHQTSQGCAAEPASLSSTDVLSLLREVKGLERMCGNRL
mmetsp:Transcript_40773/g.73657  ORF Transcript_40773/g.73657 Transcript_40773/m.73657 type:complete len:439 (-) Transcript_40773:34-1350(-)